MMSIIPEIKNNNGIQFRTRLLLGILFASLLVFILIGAGSIPFYFESPSMYYKFGADKIFLRFGKVLGITAYTLTILQLVIMSRFNILKKVFLDNNLFSAHKINGIIIAVLALSHPFLVSASNSFNIIKMDLVYWPEFAGIFLLINILIIVITALYRSYFKLTFNEWKMLHRALTFAVMLIMHVHVLFTSEAFKSGSIPRNIVFLVFGLYGILFIRLKYKNYHQKKENMS